MPELCVLRRCRLTSLTFSPGGQIGHRKYDCPEQRNFTANIICRVCGNAGHMARDCPDRQRGTDTRNTLPGGLPPQRRLGPADAVDREMEVGSVTYLLRMDYTLTCSESHARAVRQSFWKRGDGPYRGWARNVRPW